MIMRRASATNSSRILPVHNDDTSPSRRVVKRSSGDPFAILVYKKGLFSLHPKMVLYFSVFAVIALLSIHLYLLRTAYYTKETTVSHFNTTTTTTTTTAASSTIQLEPVVRPIDFTQYTIRINTWKRLEQLELSVNHYESCPGVAQIQIVWCTAQGEPPSWFDEHPKVVVEHHDINSLNERFHILQEPPTIGILSMDDDVLRPCLALDAGFFKWTHNPHRMVGFDARTHSIESDDNNNNKRWTYGYLSTSERTNHYSMTLTRFAFVHRDYLYSYMNDMPPGIRDVVAENLNCEDIAMSFWVSSLTDAKPPLLADQWAIKTQVKLYSPATISGTDNHKQIRDHCVDYFADILHLKDGLVPVERVHKKDSFFDCGAPADNIRTNSPKPQRQVELEQRIRKWKSKEVMTEDLGELKANMSRPAWDHGLIESSPPWRRRYKSNQK